MKTREVAGMALNTKSEAEMAKFSLHRVNSSQEDLLARLDSANRTIRTLEQRVAMQQRTYVAAMQEKNRAIRELQLCLQCKQ